MTYSLFQLLVFFDTQFHCDFQAIYEVLDIIDSKTIPDDDKLNLILQTLRQAALFDNDFLKKMPDNVKQSILEVYQKKYDEQKPKK